MFEASFDVDHFVQLLTRLAIALALALPIGWEREFASRSAGLRTFPLVALASCGFVVTALPVLGDDAEAQARVFQGLITGIGFIGGGAILKDRKAVRGTATAASVWSTGAVGAAAGYGRYETAVLISLMTLLVLGVLSAVERRAGRQPDGSDEDGGMAS
ncbi:MAG TPA: MgtC/SapB family protein [Gemmatimonadaceae bacterium]|nr:MgtC/SapB family protein [Gemmatimonadaceae bacterium]